MPKLVDSKPSQSIFAYHDEFLCRVDFDDRVRAQEFSYQIGNFGYFCNLPGDLDFWRPD